jgi:hypothetical protein
MDAKLAKLREREAEVKQVAAEKLRLLERQEQQVRDRESAEVARVTATP